MEQIWKSAFDQVPASVRAKSYNTITIIIISCCLHSLFKIIDKTIYNGMRNSSDKYSSCPLSVSVCLCAKFGGKLYNIRNKYMFHIWCAVSGNTPSHHQLTVSGNSSQGQWHHCRLFKFKGLQPIVQFQASVAMFSLLPSTADLNFSFRC